LRRYCLLAPEHFIRGLDPHSLNLDEPYPKQVFTILIWGENRSKFGTPEHDYKANRICATAKITDYRGAPEIVADSPKHFTVE
jgi:hypothetical protein